MENSESVFVPDSPCSCWNLQGLSQVHGCLMIYQQLKHRILSLVRNIGRIMIKEKRLLLVSLLKSAGPLKSLPGLSKVKRFALTILHLLQQITFKFKLCGILQLNRTIVSSAFVSCCQNVITQLIALNLIPNVWLTTKHVFVLRPDAVISYHILLFALYRLRNKPQL